MDGQTDIPLCMRSNIAERDKKP